jgi:hypothetical protein
MRALLRTILVISVSIGFFSCQKEISIDTPVGNSGSAGGNYQPLSAGSFWTYKDSATGSIRTITATNTTKTISGRLYTALLSTPAVSADTAFQAVDGANYFLTAEGSGPNTGAPFNITFHYLNDTAAVGTTWRYNAGSGNGFTAYINTTIAERNIAHTVNGKAYNDVIHTHLEIEYDIFGTLMNFGTYEYYNAKGIGCIQTISTFDGMGATYRIQSDLIDYSIN